MFQCGNCKTSTKPRQPVNVVVTVKRAMNYHNTIIRGPDRREEKDSEGFETVKAVNTCPDCYKTLTGLQPVIVETPVPMAKQAKKPKAKPWNEIKQKYYEEQKKTNPHWKDKRELDEIRRRESKSTDPRPQAEKRKPVVETVTRIPRK